MNHFFFIISDFRLYENCRMDQSGPENICRDDENIAGEQTVEAVEPKLKYTRLIHDDVQTILTEYGVSCLTAHSKFLCIGTNWGSIHFSDFEGNIVNNQRLRPHHVPVNQISVGNGGEFVATCADDGNVIIYDLSLMGNTETHVHKLSLGRCVTSVAIDPLFSRSGNHPYFITGGDCKTGCLMLHQRKFFGLSKSIVLYDGTVHSTRWHKHFVAWASDVGVQVYDTLGRCSLEPVQWDTQNTALPAPLHKCSLTWTDNDRLTLLVGWADTVRMCGLERQRKRLRDGPSYVVRLLLEFRIDYIISGIGLLDDDQFVILCNSKEKHGNDKLTKPKLCVFEARGSNHIELYNDKLSLRDFQNYGCNDYALESLVEENLFVVVSPRDIIVAHPYDDDDRIEWLMKHYKYPEAMEIASSKNLFLKKNSLISVGKTFSDHLFSMKNYAEAGNVTAEFCGNDKHLWQEEIIKFEKVQQLRQISAYVPTGDVTLDHIYYEKILNEYLNEEPEGFLKLVKQWPPSLYDVSSVTNVLSNHLALNLRLDLLEALAILFTHSGKFQGALKLYLHINHKGIFELITEYNLYSLIHGMIEDLMRLDCERAIQILVHTKEIRIDDIMGKLQNNKLFLYKYLVALTKKDPSVLARYNLYDDLILLYAKFAYEKLLPLLTQNDYYSIEKALDECKRLNYYPEMAYLLGRMGDNKEKLNIVVNKLCDIEQAIDICKNQNESYLWDDLINFSLDKPDFLLVLLQKISTYTDPRILIRKIGRNTHIPDLKNIIANMITDCKLQVSVEEEHTKIVVADCFRLLENYNNEMKSGWGVDQDNICNACNKCIIGQDRVGNALVFYCQHMFHEECIPVVNGSRSKRCIICKNSQVKLKTFKWLYGSRSLL